MSEGESGIKFVDMTSMGERMNSAQRETLIENVIKPFTINGEPLRPLVFQDGDFAFDGSALFAGIDNAFQRSANGEVSIKIPYATLEAIAELFRDVADEKEVVMEDPDLQEEQPQISQDDLAAFCYDFAAKIRDELRDDLRIDANFTVVVSSSTEDDFEIQFAARHNEAKA